MVVGLVFLVGNIHEIHSTVKMKSFILSYSLREKLNMTEEDTRQITKRLMLGVVVE